MLVANAESEESATVAAYMYSQTRMIDLKFWSVDKILEIGPP